MLRGYIDILLEEFKVIISISINDSDANVCIGMVLLSTIYYKAIPSMMIHLVLMILWQGYWGNIILNTLYLLDRYQSWRGFRGIVVSPTFVRMHLQYQTQRFPLRLGIWGTHPLHAQSCRQTHSNDRQLTDVLILVCQARLVLQLTFIDLYISITS